MLQVRENEILLRNSSGGPEYLLTLEGTLLTMQCKWTFRKRPFYTTNKMPHVTVTITKKRFVGSNNQAYYYYDNLHSAQSADFQRKAFLFK